MTLLDLQVEHAQRSEKGGRLPNVAGSLFDGKSKVKWGKIARPSGTK